MCGLRNIAMGDYQESLTIGQTDRQTPDKVITMLPRQHSKNGQDKKDMTNKNFDEHKNLTKTIFKIYNFLFIRPSSDGTYYGMVMSVRPTLHPYVRPPVFHIFLQHTLTH